MKTNPTPTHSPTETQHLQTSESTINTYLKENKGKQLTNEKTTINTNPPTETDSCKKCKGTGWRKIYGSSVLESVRCERCDGTGETKTSHTEPTVDKWEEIEATIRFSKSDYAVKIVKEYVAHSVQEAKEEEAERILSGISPMIDLIVKAIPKYKRREKVEQAIKNLSSLKQEEEKVC